MSVYDLSKSKFLPLEQLLHSIEKYHVYFQGKELLSPSVDEIRRIIQQESEKQLKNQSSNCLIIREKQRESKKSATIQAALSNRLLLNNYSEEELRMFQENPSSLFRDHMWGFQYARDKWTEEVSHQRYEELKQDLMTRSENWKQATLEQLQMVSKKRHLIFEDSLKQ